jgi:hypothetical protein
MFLENLGWLVCGLTPLCSFSIANIVYFVDNINAIVPFCKNTWTYSSPPNDDDDDDDDDDDRKNGSLDNCDSYFSNKLKKINREH